MKKLIIKICVYVVSIAFLYGLMDTLVYRLNREYWYNLKSTNCVLFYKEGNRVDMENLLVQVQGSLESLAKPGERVKLFVYPSRNENGGNPVVINGSILCNGKSPVDSGMLIKALKYNRDRAKYKKYKPAAI